MAEAQIEELVDGRYRLRERIGSGGMADVHRAEDTQLARDVALKVLHRRFARDEQFVERFRREASAAAALQHPNVVNVYDRGEHDGTYYIAMECLEGRTLKDVIAQEAPIDQERTIDIGIQILYAAGFAHRSGVIHRDFKPQNVIIDDSDHVKVTDFGIARAGASEITETGSILGTAQYLSPEQAEGSGVGEESDLYSIGVILYEMLSGRLPFEGDSAVSIAVKHLSEEPQRLAALRPDIHPGLEAAVMRALTKDPRYRWQSAEELIAALQAARAQIAMGDEGQGTAVWAPLPAGPGSPSEEEEEERRRRRWPWLVVPLLLAGLVAAGLVLFGGPPEATVPEVTGETLADAERELEAAGFAVKVERRNDSEADYNDVLEQHPPAGEEVDEGSTVALVVSDGAEQRLVPKVIGLPQDRALKKLENRGFTADVSQAPSSAVAEGNVVSTTPAPGTRAPVDSPVEVTISTGPRQVEVPSLIGNTRGAAEAELSSLGLGVDAVEVESDEPPGLVVDQDPPEGTTVEEGATVEISVSLGPPEPAAEPAPPPEPDTVNVPNVVGEDESQAISEIEGAGLAASSSEQATTDPAKDGVVLSQSPGGGTEVEEGSTVSIVVGAYEPPDEGGRGSPQEPGGGAENPGGGRPGRG